MNGADAATVYTPKPLSMKMACVGFIASTTAMIVVMVVIGNLA